MKFDIPNYNGIGIYSIVCNETGERYIGSSEHVFSRLKSHLYSFNKGTCNPKISGLLKKGYTFKAEILEKISYGINRFQLLEKEHQYIKKYNTIKLGLNLAYNEGESLSSQIRLLNVWENEPPSKLRNRAIKYIEELIEKRSRPIYQKKE